MVISYLKRYIYASPLMTVVAEPVAHPSLHFKKTGKYRSVRIGMHFQNKAPLKDAPPRTVKI
jgi:hypothetical protein